MVTKGMTGKREAFERKKGEDGTRGRGGVEAESLAASLCMQIYLGRFRPFVFLCSFTGVQSRSRLHICRLQP